MSHPVPQGFALPAPSAYPPGTLFLVSQGNGGQLFRTNGHFWEPCGDPFGAQRELLDSWAWPNIRMIHPQRGAALYLSGALPPAPLPRPAPRPGVFRRLEVMLSGELGAGRLTLTLYVNGEPTLISVLLDDPEQRYVVWEASTAGPRFAQHDRVTLIAQRQGMLAPRSLLVRVTVSYD